MPLELRPPAGEAVPTKDVTPPGLYTEGPAREYFTIPKLFDAATRTTAQEEATTKIQKANTPVETRVDQNVFRRALIRLNLSGWRLIVPPGEPFNTETMFVEDGNYFWHFTPGNVAKLPDPIVLWLADEIVT